VELTWCQFLIILEIVALCLQAVWTLDIKVASHWMNSQAEVSREEDAGEREARIVSAAARFRPTIIMLHFTKSAQTTCYTYVTDLD
jgi:hypothetical protein